MTHAMLGFEVKGGWRDVKGSVAMTALQYLMGGGGSFSAGGPGTAVVKRDCSVCDVVVVQTVLHVGHMSHSTSDGGFDPHCKGFYLFHPTYHAVTY